MPTSLLPHWEFRGKDWITAVDVLGDQLVFVGSRDGTLWILNRHGSQLDGFNLGSWIGALRVLDLRDEEWPEDLRGIYLLLGTKRGLVRFFRVVWTDANVQRVPVFEFNARNTVREIDVAITSSPPRATVAIGSEDKHVYIVDFAEAVRHTAGLGEDVTVVQPAVNGWIRSVAFYHAPGSDDTLVAAACGDKNIYFFATDGTEVNRLYVASKVHSLISDTRGSAIYATSDAKTLYVIGGRQTGFRVIHRQPLPHRATKLAFMDSDCRQILAACEDGRIYVFDTRQRRLTSYVDLKERVFAMRSAMIQQTRILMLGLAYGRLVASMYSLGEDVPPAMTRELRGSLAEYGVEEESRLAEIEIYGPKRASITVGIGRFIHLVRPHPNAYKAAVVGTDGGEVAVVELSTTGSPEVIYRASDPAPARVWAVSGVWEDESTLTLCVATSDKEIQFWKVVISGALAERVGSETVQLRDWPREIRPVVNQDRPSDRAILVACENGDVSVVGDDGPTFNTGQTLRTGYARRREGRYEIVTGSDDNRVSMYVDAQPRWEFHTLDRVREVLIHDEECLAVCEDRFLYVLSLDGDLRHRYRFPHRALCIDLYSGPGRTLWYVVGCGDGFVYFVDEAGWVKDAYEFPDRIRDVRVHENWELIVACEDGKVYFAPCLDHYLEDHFEGMEIEVIDRTVQELRLRAGDPEGLRAVQELSDDDKLLLLAYVEDWYDPPDSELIVSLIDSSLESVLAGGLVKLHYVYAAALVHLATRVNFAAGKSRIERFIDKGQANPYAIHAIIASIGKLGIHRRQVSDRGASAITLVDSIVSAVPIDDEWILSECVRNLHRSEFFDLTQDGFVRFFRTVRIGFGKLQRILRAAAELPAVKSSALMGLLELLGHAEIDRPAFAERYLQLVESNDDVVRDCLDHWDTARWGTGDADDRVMGLLGWLLNVVRSGEIRSVLEGFLKDYSLRTSSGAGVWVLAADLIEARLLQQDVAVTAQDYLCVATVCGAMRALGRTAMPAG